MLKKKIKIIKYLAIIPARKGSKRILNKNIIKIKNKSLFTYTLNAAIKSKKIGLSVLTTNIPNILNIKKNKLIVLKRDEKLCLDKTETEPVILDVIEKLKYKFLIKNIVLLQPTSPFRKASDIDKAIEIFEKKNFDSLFSMCKRKVLIWSYLKKLKPINYKISERMKNQNKNKILIENGAIFIFKVNKFIKIKNRLFGNIGTYEMDQISSIEIDSYQDLKITKKLSNFL